MATRIRYSSGAFVYMPGKCGKKVRPAPARPIGGHNFIAKESSQ
jgi:hypothetical protein